MFKSQKWLVAGAAVGLWAVLGSSASADTRFNTAGSVCQPEDRNSTEWGYSPQFGIFRKCSNCSGSPNVVCPLVFGTPAGGHTTGMFVDVYDRNSSSDVVCTYFQLFIDGSVGFSQTLQSTGNQGPPQQLSFGVPNFDLNDATLYCSVPPQTSSGFSHVANMVGIGTP
jgi:hypothetical protein